MSVKQGFQIVVMGEQSSDIEAQKHHCYDDFDDASEAFSIMIEEETGTAIQKPRRLSEASITIANVLYQIWRIEYQQN